MADCEGARADGYPKLSRPFKCMKSEYDVVVIGSGYGSGVSASRMARAGKTVAVLELGWERRPGSYPHTLFQCLGEMHISGTSAKNSNLIRWFPSGSATRLFQLMLGDGQHAFHAHGLGGCSLINAGVFIEADKRTLQMSPWPPEIRNDPSACQPYYSRAASMLQPSTYPENLPQPTKLQHLQAQSRSLNMEQNFHRAAVTTFFRNSRNNVGVAMPANSCSGHESTGLNDGSKNSVTTTYLADAWNWGAEIFCGCEVRFVEQGLGGKGYTIYFAWHGSGRADFKNHFKHQLFWVKAKEFCFLGAGALGTTEILLRSREHGMKMSPLVGRNLSGNGDLLVFGYNGDADINGIAGEQSNGLNRPGPTITGMIDNRLSDASSNPLSGYVIEDGCIPEPFKSFIQIMLIWQTIGGQTLLSLQNFPLRLRKIFAALKSLILGPYANGGAIQRTATYLVMSHDSNELTLTLKGDKLVLRAPAEGRSEHFAKVKAILNTALGHFGEAMGYSYFYGRDQEEVTVHLLGGANMSRNGTGREGVTNHLGEVYSGTGSEVYQGLVCCDASTIPTALGANPLATISALAERSVALLAERSQLSIDLETKNGPLDACSKPMVSPPYQYTANQPKNIKEGAQSIGWHFTEILQGYICVNSNIEDFTISETVGKGSSCAMQVYLTIDICQYSKGPRYRGECTGTASCFALSKATLRVVDGNVTFFSQRGTKAEGMVISYFLQLLSLEGTQYYLHGHKYIDSNICFSPSKTWEATTTLNVTITRIDGSNVGAGVLRIPWTYVLRQMRTFRANEKFNADALLCLLMFFAFFVYNISRFFFRPFVAARFPQQSAKAVTKLKRRPSCVCKVTASDGVQVLLEIYEPFRTAEENYEPRESKAPSVLCIPGVTGVGTEHQIFALPFLRCNMADYLTARGHRCYILTPRWACNLAVAQDCIVFDCRLDIAAALEYICNRESHKPYVVAHCQGSVALAMGLLDGTIPRRLILGITANSVFMNQVFGYWNSVKGRTTLLIQLYQCLEGNFFPLAKSANDSTFKRLLDILLRFYPVGRRRDICHSTACHRASFGFGLLWNHENLDRQIHDNIHRFLTGTHTKMLKHVVRMGTHGMCLDDSLRPLLTPKFLERLRGVPIMFMSGTDNEVYSPESTLRDYELLRRRFGEESYRRFLVEGYGHLDPIIGKDAAEDVYWRVFEHLQWCLRRTGAENIS